MLQVVDDPQEIEEAIITFAAAKGNIPLAAERLHIPQTLLVSLISKDQELLLQHLKIMAIINTFESLGTAHNNLKVAIPNMEPYEQAKTYTALLQIAESLTHAPPPAASSHVNILQIMQALPVDAREALTFLLKDGHDNGHSE